MIIESLEYNCDVRKRRAQIEMEFVGRASSRSEVNTLNQYT